MNHTAADDPIAIFVDAATNRSYSFDQVKTAATNFGRGLLQQWNWRTGDILATYTANSIDSPAVVWGTRFAGGVVSPANPAYTADELAFQLQDSGARALVTQLPLLQNALRAARKAGLTEDRIILLGDTRDESFRFKHFTAIQKPNSTPDYERVEVNDPAKELAFLVYSSGTTGLPKGTMLTHRNMVAVILMGLAGRSDIDSNDLVLGFLPFFHVYGLTILLHQTLYRGLTCVVMERFELEQWCKLVQEHKITYSYVVPPVILALSKHPVVDKYDLSSIRMMASGGSTAVERIGSGGV